MDLFHFHEPSRRLSSKRPSLKYLSRTSRWSQRVVFKKGLKSDDVLAVVRDGLGQLGFRLELGKEREQRIVRPVFFGMNGDPEKTYSVDAYHDGYRCGLEVEAGRAVGGNAIYRDLIQTMVMVEVDHLVLAVPNAYKYGKSTVTDDFKHTVSVANALFGHTRLTMPYGLTVLGY